MSTIKLNRMGKEIKIDTKDALINIQKELRRNNHDREGDGLTDAIINQMATFNMVIQGMLNLHENTGANLPDDMVTALQLEWYELEALIKEREEENHNLWNIAFAKDQG